VARLCRRFAAIGAEYPDVRKDAHHIDIMAAGFVMHPEQFDVVVGSNLSATSCRIWDLDAPAPSP